MCNFTHFGAILEDLKCSWLLLILNILILRSDVTQPLLSVNLVKLAIKCF